MNFVSVLTLLPNGHSYLYRETGARAYTDYANHLILRRQIIEFPVPLQVSASSTFPRLQEKLSL